MLSYEEKLEQLNETGEVLEKTCTLLDGFEGGLVGHWIGPDYSLHAVYDKTRMLEFYCMDNKCSMEDAVEWFEFNTLQSLPYINEDQRPIIMDLY